MSQSYKERMALLNQFAAVRFERTQPREWRGIPFAGKRTWWRGWARFAVWALFWAAVAVLSLLSISQGAGR